MPAEQVKLAAFADRQAHEEGMAAFYEAFERPHLREDVDALLHSSIHSNNIVEGIEVHDSTFDFGRDAPASCLSNGEAIALCDVFMDFFPDPDWEDRSSDMPRCVGAGYDVGIKRLAELGGVRGRAALDRPHGC